jgi:hypothetical protein
MLHVRADVRFHDQSSSPAALLVLAVVYCELSQLALQDVQFVVRTQLSARPPVAQRKCFLTGNGCPHTLCQSYISSSAALLADGGNGTRQSSVLLLGLNMHF